MNNFLESNKTAKEFLNEAETNIESEFKILLENFIEEYYKKIGNLISFEENTFKLPTLSLKFAPNIFIDLLANEASKYSSLSIKEIKKIIIKIYFNKLYMKEILINLIVEIFNPYMKDIESPSYKGIGPQLYNFYVPITKKFVSKLQQNDFKYGIDILHNIQKELFQIPYTFENEKKLLQVIEYIKNNNPSNLWKSLLNNLER